jgi:hypothetical protein
MKRTYFQPEVLVSTDCHGDRSVTLFREHRPLQLYMNALIKAGFHVEELLELSDEDETRDRDGIPMFLDLVATRIPRPPQAAPVRDVARRRPLRKTRGRVPVSVPSRLTGVGLWSALLPGLLAKMPRAWRGRSL